MSGQRALFSLHVFFTQEISSTMTHHLANSLKQDVLHILPALKIYFSLHIWNFSEVHSPSSSSSARQHQCSKQAIRCHRKFLYIIYISKMCTTYINASKNFFCVSFMDRLFLKVGHTKKNLSYHTKINSYHCYCEYSTFALQRSFVELLTYSASLKWMQ